MFWVKTISTFSKRPCLFHSSKTAFSFADDTIAISATFLANIIASFTPSNGCFSSSLNKSIDLFTDLDHSKAFFKQILFVFSISTSKDSFESSLVSSVHLTNSSNPSIVIYFSLISISATANPLNLFIPLVNV